MMATAPVNGAERLTLSGGVLRSMWSVKDARLTEAHRENARNTHHAGHCSRLSVSHASTSGLPACLVCSLTQASEAVYPHAPRLTSPVLVLAVAIPPMPVFAARLYARSPQW